MPATSTSPLIDLLPSGEVPTFQSLLERLWDTRYCGAVTLHFAGGRPLAVVLQQEVKIPLLTGARESSVD